jgi:hypothetical protein
MKRKYLFCAAFVLVVWMTTFVLARERRAPCRNLLKFHPREIVHREAYGGKLYLMRFDQPPAIVAAELGITLPADWKPGDDLTYRLQSEDADESMFDVYGVAMPDKATCGIRAAQVPFITKVSTWFRRKIPH